jgi:peptide/nickel transport system ATP-binding protein
MMDLVLQAAGITHRYGRKGDPVLRDVDLSVERGMALGIIGESGSGKTTIGRILVGAIRPDEGDATVLGSNWSTVKRRDERRRRVQMIFQDPYGSLNPWLTPLQAVTEAAYAWTPSRRAAQSQARDLLAEVGLVGDVVRRKPSGLSGGQRQRVGIARALATDPIAIVADEPTSSLDVSVQAQIVNLIDDLRHQRGLALVLISHDLAVVRHLTDSVVVMRRGQVVECGPTSVTLSAPDHEYTRELVVADRGW